MSTIPPFRYSTSTVAPSRTIPPPVDTAPFAPCIWRQVWIGANVPDGPYPKTKNAPDAEKNPGIRACSTTTATRSEEHTSELQSRGHLVCRLLLEKKNTASATEKQRQKRHKRRVRAETS